MKLNWKLSIAFLLSIAQGKAQNQGTGHSGTLQRKQFSSQTSINISPLALISVDNELMLGIEQRLKKDWAITTDAGMVFDSYYISNIKGANGFEIRPAIRYYHGRYKRDYWQAQFSYKMVNYQFHEWLGKDVVNGVAAYEQLQDFTFRKKVWSFSLMAGGMIPLSNKFFLDLYGGFGARYKEQAVTEPNALFLRLNTSRGIVYDPVAWVICVPAGVKLSFILR